MIEKIIICEICGGDNWRLLTETVTKSGGIPEIMDCKNCYNIFSIPKQ